MAPKKKESTQDKQQSVSSKKQTRKIDPVIVEVDKNNTEIKSIDDLIDKNQKIFIKHLVECNCVLPQYKDMEPTVFHKFIVFSEIKKDGSIKQTYIKCNNCDAIHKILEVAKTEIQKKESTNVVPTIEDIKTNIPVWLSTLLQQNDCPLPTWQEAQFIIENNLWNKFIILSREKDSSNQEKYITKYVLILGENLHRVRIDEGDDNE